MWVLILTLFVSNGNAITSVSGFTSEDMCVDAGNKWKAHLISGSYSPDSMFACVKNQQL